MGRFLTDMPSMHLVDPSEWRDGLPTWELDEPFEYEVRAARNGRRAWVVYVPIGSRTNFASIPWLLRWLIPPIGRKYRRATLVHDHLCDLETCPRPIADVVFLVAMADEGLWWVKRYPMYFGVRFWGMLSRQG